MTTAQQKYYSPEIEWDTHLRHYTTEVALETGREQLVFDTLQKAFDYRKQYMADIQLLLIGEPAVFNSGAVL